ncbi:sugar 3,4-ketoisomerase [Candidatus Pelagibacter communis]|uniref:sugar 3,4-ketoisomerase n=1 Tax=Pelagibacter ubique TaxID=198252 RepID=UPI00094D595B|nr:FdtA/QdtA family cupin domain-containing protein [Candidatus Pelagibacter ubique]
MKLKLKKSKTFSDKTGDLIPFYKNESLLNFNIKRFFFVYGNKRYFRADHAHKKCNQVLIPINGTIEVYITNKNKKERKFLLSLRSNNYLFVPKDHWIKLKFIKKKSILLTLCDYKYDKKEYIQSKKKFFKK